ncbi:unnamed protein product [Rotaria sp. Silwood1]|nr:unnamed protein product [Rotaria sp. Silwood1]CAF4983941.1 unnamed protein product [Rotaria sp. Silwood1]CAF5030307.1 unnamed protein product [Rotaria sp. Silwood1]
MFHTVTTVSGHKVSFTELYLIPVIENDITVNYVSAKQIKIDDVLYVTSNDHLIASTITTKIMKTKSGYYASLTMSGVVNGIMSSCYDNVQNHESTHFSSDLLRGFYR